MQLIQTTRDDGIATITINRAEKKNSVTLSMWGAMLDALRAVAGDPQVRVVVVTGAGGEFCAGADLWSEADQPPMSSLELMRFVGEVAQTLHDLPQPTLAKVRGVAVGAGCNLAFGCDLVVAGSTARFSQIFSRRGLSLDFGGSWQLPRRVGLHIAKEIAFFGDILSADQAAGYGLVNRVVPDDELDAFVDEWVARLAAGPPLALARSKRMLNAAMGRTMAEALDDESRAQADNFATEDAAEALAAFMERREPRFVGR